MHPAGFIEAQIESWRRRSRRLPPPELTALEARLRQEIAGLTAVGLAPDEAWIVAEKRVDEITPKPAPHAGPRVSTSHSEALVAFGFAVLAAVAIKIPELFGIDLDRRGGEAFYFRNLSLFVLPCLIGFFIWKRRAASKVVFALAGAFSVAAVFANLPGFGAAEGFWELVSVHLPITLWLAVGIAHAGGRWREVDGRMDFIRFTGEIVIYYVLIALGGGVLCAFMALTFKSIGINIGPFFGMWLIPCGASGAVVIASWLVESRQRVMESMAPVLTRLFTPLFAVMLVAFVATSLWSGRGMAIDRELLIGFDLLLVVVLGLLVYALSARDPRTPPGAFDWVQLVLVVAALIADALALTSISVRVQEFGVSPNRVAALGENIILLINLTWSAVLYARFLLKRGSLHALERWQTGYIPVYSAWAAIVVIVFPLVFR